MRAPNRCPRCSGNLLCDYEDGLPEWCCLQCGRRFQPQMQSLAASAPTPIVPPVFSTAPCEECGATMSGAASARRRYCTDRCRMRAARRRWAGREDSRMAG